MHSKDDWSQVFVITRSSDVAIFQTGIWAKAWSRSEVLIIQAATQKQMPTLLQGITMLLPGVKTGWCSKNVSNVVL